MGRPRGLEPPTSGTTNRRSNQLSYDRHMPSIQCRMPPQVEWDLGVCAKRSSHSDAPYQQGGEPIAHTRPNAKRKVPRTRLPATTLTAQCRLANIAGDTNTMTMQTTTNPGATTPAKLLKDTGVRQVPNARLSLFDRPDFLPPALCRDLVTLIDQGRRPSTIADSDGDNYFRTSETCDLAAEELAVQDLEARLLALHAIDPAYGEPVQGQRYDVGQEFKAHTDYFEPNGADFTKYCGTAGNRTWTFMIYLNEVEAGGATRFKVIGKTFQPAPGKLLCWDNRRTDGSLNPATLHHGMKVRKGVKYVITKWYREKPWG